MFDHLTTIDTIYHISDVHIRNIKRHSEYPPVFQNLYNIIKQDTKNAIICVTGDTVHSKIDISPEAIDLMAGLFEDLSKLCPTIIIAGNHDANLNNESRMDSITPLYNRFKQYNNNIKYIKYSEKETIGNIDLIVYSVFDKILIPPDINSKNTQILLYHGALHNSTLSNGFALVNDELNITAFNGYDIVLLGDIHKHQFLQQYSSKEYNLSKTGSPQRIKELKQQGAIIVNENDEQITLKTKLPVIAYASSLIQQDFGESLDGHGIIKWDVNNRTGQFIEVPNDFGYITLNLANDNISSMKYPKRTRLRLQIPDSFVSTDIHKALAEVKQYTDVHDYIINTIPNKNNVINEFDMNIVNNINDPNYQLKLIKDYISQKYGDNVVEAVLSDIEILNNKFNEQIKKYDTNTNKSIFELLSFEFDNLFSYGTGNYVDFSKIKGIYGLFAANDSGKSAFIDALLYALYGTSSRAGKLLDVMNYNSKDMYSKVNFRIGNTLYYIERRGTKKFNKQGLPNIVTEDDFYYIDENNKRKYLNGDKKTELKQILANYIGTYDVAVITAISLQNSQINFINMYQYERKSLINDLIGINIFDKLEKIGKQEASTIYAERDILLNNNLETQKEENNLKLELDNKEYNEIVKIVDKYTKDIDKLNEEINLLNKNLKPISKIDDISILLKNKRKYKQQLKNTKKLIYKIFNNIDAYQTKINEINENIKQFDIVDIELQLKLQSSYKLDVDLLDKKLLTANIEYKNKLKSLEQLKDLQYDENCSYCMNNVFVKDAIKYKTSIINDQKEIEKITNEINNINDEINNLNIYYDKQQKYKAYTKSLQTNKQKLNSKELKLQILKTKFQLLLNNLKTTNNNVSIYNKNIDDINSNKIIDENIGVHKNNLLLLTTELNKHQNKKQNLFSNINLYTHKLETINESLDKLLELEYRSKVYDYYLEAINKDNIPHIILKQIIGYLMDKVNEILTEICDFNIIIALNDNNIEISLIDAENTAIPIELSGGYKKFFTSNAIRMALLSISTNPKPNIFIMDEGFGVMDGEKISTNLPKLFDYLRYYFDSILIISHIYLMKDFVDKNIDIVKENNRSKIFFD